ncbi:MAG TPA: beta-galactosidase trimerization domain-containing protein [bacterium]|nr:beta-galactosidase trimerization domain-containing protein [bacterium]
MTRFIKTTVSMCLFLLTIVLINVAYPDIFLEAENFKITGTGWKVAEGDVARSASRLKVLQGSSGQFDSVAYDTVAIPEKATYRIWVRYSQKPDVRGTFKLVVIQNGNEIASKEFDLESTSQVAKDRRLGMDYVWDYVDAELPAGNITLKFVKTGQKNVHRLSRCIDCVLITQDTKQKPDHTAYGPGIYVRVTVGDGYEKPFYIHIFADYYRSPWYAHYSLTPDGLDTGIRPVIGRKYCENNTKTGWINIAKLMYWDVGTNLVISPRYTYSEIAPKFNVKFEFASDPDEANIVKVIERNAEPSGIHIIIPPDFNTPEGAKKLVDDLEIAESTGKLADLFTWPGIGKKPQLFSFRASFHSGEGGFAPLDKKVSEREWKTLDYFGFSNKEKLRIGGLWLMKNDCYNQPDIDKMKERLKANIEEMKKQNIPFENIAFAMLMDEPGGQPLSHLVNCSVCNEKFVGWLKSQGKKPSDLLVKDWNEVKIVDETQTETYPALYYYSQRFRSRALADFMILQKNMIKEAYGKNLPASPNFSDGATYVANFYAQGVDYFEILEPGGMNALWSENWGNGSLTRECTTYNVELMRSAAMKNNQVLGHYLIVYAGRLPWDIKAITASQVARNVKFFESFFYGPSWAGHEGGPPWRSSSLYAHPEKWYSQAEIIREIGWAEGMLIPAKKIPSPVAILYSSSSDIWDLKKNYSYGFERMFTWLALTHRQIPVDFVSEQSVAEKGLSGYKVCYFSGRNLLPEAAEKLKQWVKNGGVLCLTAGAGSKDQYNRSSNILDEIIPARCDNIQELQNYLSSGRYLDRLSPKDTVTTKNGTAIPVLSVKQLLNPKPGSLVLGNFSDGTVAIVAGKSGKGMVYYSGFLPAGAYAYQALVDRNQIAAGVNITEVKAPEPDRIATETQLLTRSYNPWKYPEDIRNLITSPVLEAKVQLPVVCDTPLVDAVAMECELGLVIPIANYTLQPLNSINLQVQTRKAVKTVESAHCGHIPFKQEGNIVKFSIPLKETDFVKILY